MARISIVGTGYVGLVIGACFVELGNGVTCIDVDDAKVTVLQQGELPIYEPKLQEIVQRNLTAKRLRFTTGYTSGLAHAEFVFIAVNTPLGSAGEAVMHVVEAAVPHLTSGRDPYEVADGCHALVLLTEWNEFKHLDMRRVREAMALPVLIDGRNLYDPATMTRLGFVYCGIGRGQPVHYPQGIVSPLLKPAVDSGSARELAALRSPARSRRLAASRGSGRGRHPDYEQWSSS